MLRFLAPKLPLRTNASHLTSIPLDNGRSQLLFNDAINTSQDLSPISPYLVTNHLPPAPPPPDNPDTPNSSLCPPFHIHLKEDETFHVISGTAKFLLLDQRKEHGSSTTNDISTDGITTRLVSANNTVTIPQGQIHTFRNGSTSDPLVIEFGFSLPLLSPSSNPVNTNNDGGGDSHAYEAEKAHLHAKMHRFFRNTQLYRSDCTKHNLPRAMSQVLLFNYHADVALVPPFLLNLHRRYPAFRSLIERFVAPLVGRVMNFFGGVILGRWMFGFRANYAEYFQPISASTGEKKDGKQSQDVKAEDVLCQAWRDHNFDGQSEDWRK